MAETAQTRRARRSLAKRSRSRVSVCGAGAVVSAGVIASRRLEAVLARTRSGRVQDLLDAADRGRLVDPLDRGELADETIERRLIDLSLAIGLLGLTDIAIEVAHDFRNRRRIAGIDLRLVFLSAPAPHRPL